MILQVLTQRVLDITFLDASLFISSLCWFNLVFISSSYKKNNFMIKWNIITGKRTKKKCQFKQHARSGKTFAGLSIRAINLNTCIGWVQNVYLMGSWYYRWACIQLFPFTQRQQVCHRLQATQNSIKALIDLQYFWYMAIWQEIMTC